MAEILRGLVFQLSIVAAESQTMSGIMLILLCKTVTDSGAEGKNGCDFTELIADTGQGEICRIDYHKAVRYLIFFAEILYPLV